MCYVKFEPTSSNNGNNNGVTGGQPQEPAKKRSNGHVDNGTHGAEIEQPMKPFYYYGDIESHGLIYSYIAQYIGMHMLVGYAYYYWWTSWSEPTFIRTWFYGESFRSVGNYDHLEFLYSRLPPLYWH